MKRNYLFLMMLALVSISFFSIAQIPTNGLVGYYPFNGNANDESGNGYNGINNGALLTADRFGNTNSAFIFNNNFIKVQNSENVSFSNGITFCAWINTDTFHLGGIIDKANFTSGFRLCSRSSNSNSLYNKKLWAHAGGYNAGVTAISTSTYSLNNWQFIVGSYNPIDDTVRIFINGIFEGSAYLNQLSDNSNNIIFGRSTPSTAEYFKGKLDDIRIYNRALTQSEVTALFNENICYQTITVTDTLIINANLSSINPVTYLHTIKVFPNPTKDHITINYGNYTSLNGYTLKITNSLGQTMFTTAINQQSTYIDLNGWTGNGTYFVSLIDAQANTVEVRKIVLQ